MTSRAKFWTCEWLDRKLPLAWLSRCMNLNERRVTEMCTTNSRLVALTADEAQAWHAIWQRQPSLADRRFHRKSVAD
jgi:hypothetical protein